MLCQYKATERSCRNYLKQIIKKLVINSNLDLTAHKIQTGFYHMLWLLSCELVCRNSKCFYQTFLVRILPKHILSESFTSGFRQNLLNIWNKCVHKDIFWNNRRSSCNFIHIFIFSFIQKRKHESVVNFYVTNERLCKTHCSSRNLKTNARPTWTNDQRPNQYNRQSSVCCTIYITFSTCLKALSSMLL